MDASKLEITLDCLPPRRGSQWLVTCTLPDGTTRTDKFDLLTHKGRRKFALSVCGSEEASGFADLLAALERKAAATVTERADRSAGSPSGAGVERLDRLDRSSEDLTDKALLVALVEGNPDIEVFFDSPNADATTYMTVRRGKLRMTWPLISPDARRWLIREFKARYNAVPTANSLKDAIHAIGAIPDEDAPTFPVYLRVAEHQGEIWIDLGGPDRAAVRITHDGWSCVESEHVPVRFVRKRGMGVMPRPLPGGTIALLDDFLVDDEDRFIRNLIVAFTISSYRPRGPYPILSLVALQGAAKSTITRFVRRLLDPHDVPMRLLIRDVRALAIHAQNTRVVAFENVSDVSGELSDALASISTGTGWGTRQLFTDDEEKLIRVCRPVILNGIGQHLTRGDAVERAIIVPLKRISPERRRTEKDLWSAFEKIEPQLLGALFTGVASAIKNQGKIRPAVLPRMADQAEWLAAAEPGLGLEPGTLERALQKNAAEAQESVVHASPIGQALVEFARQRSQWSGTYPDLTRALKHICNEKFEYADFPRSARALRSELDRLTPALAGLEITVSYSRSSNDRRDHVVHIHNVAKPRSRRSRRSRPQEDDDGTAPATDEQAGCPDDQSDSPGTSDRPAGEEVGDVGA